MPVSGGANRKGRKSISPGERLQILAEIPLRDFCCDEEENRSKQIAS